MPAQSCAGNLQLANARAKKKKLLRMQLSSLSRRRMLTAAVSVLLSSSSSSSATTPNTCQPRAAHPFMPIYHIIGNVTSDPTTGKVTAVEDINDVSAIFLWKGLYHVYHQCCQNHWDHVVSKDLMHWTRLPPPIVPNQNPTGVPHPDWYDAHGSWDGSLSVPHHWNGIKAPIVMMTTVEGTKPGTREAKNLAAGMAVGMAIVRPTDLDDPFLLSWTKDAANPIDFLNNSAITSPYDTPGQIWKNGDHWNFLVVGQRYTTKDEHFHTWERMDNETWPTGEFGGQWFSPIANLADGSVPPKSAPQWMMSVGNGGDYQLGNYHPENESWTMVNKTIIIDNGPNTAWEVGQFAGNRFMNIGWFNGGPPMESGELGFPHEKSFHYTQPPPLTETNGCRFTTNWEVFPGYTNIYDRMPSPTNATHGTLKYVGTFETMEACFAAVNKTSATDGPFHSWTYNNASVTGKDYQNHCWGDTSMTWQNRGNAVGQVSGRGPGFPIVDPLPSSFTHDHLSGLREVAYDPVLRTLVSNPVKELAGLRNGSLASETNVVLNPGTAHIVKGTSVADGVDASTSDIVLKITVPKAEELRLAAASGSSSASPAFGIRVLANVSAGAPFGGILTVVNFTAPDAASGTITATASIRTLNPCGSGSANVQPASFHILKGETTVDMRILVDRSVVEVFIMGGRVVFSKTYEPQTMYVPDTNIALQAWGTTPLDIESLDVFSMGCGWTNPPYQPTPTMESIASF